MAYNAEILTDSVSPLGHRLTTFCITYPRFILAEVNTHKILSKNSQSSRAIPLKKTIERVKNDPFVPEVWGKNKPGMSWSDALDQNSEIQNAHNLWVSASEDAIFYAESLGDLDIHKSLANRILEPYSWISTIISGTDWENFFALRTEENAQPEFRKIALMMLGLYDNSEPKLVNYGDYHLPLLQDDERDEMELPFYRERGDVWRDKEYWKKVCVGRCARISYLSHNGVRDTKEDIRLHDQLIENGHFSPPEHIATPIAESRYIVNYLGWEQYRKQIPYEDNFAALQRSRK